MINDLICLSALSTSKCLLRYREHLVGWWPVSKTRGFGFARNSAGSPHRMLRRLVVSLLVPLCALVVTAHGQDAVAPAKDAAAPTQDTATPAKDAATPAKDKPVPTKDEAAPANDEAAPTKEEVAPANDETVPPGEAVAPAPIESPSAPTKEEGKPAPEVAPTVEAAPPAEVAAPAQDAVAPAPEVAAPVEAPAAPVPEVVAPAPEVAPTVEAAPTRDAAPITEVATPVQEAAAPSPVETPPAPAKEVAAPTAEATAPVQEATTPTPEAVPPAPAITEAAAPTPEVPALVEAPAVPAEEEATPTAEAAAPTPVVEIPAPVEVPAVPAQEEEKPATELAPTAEVAAPVQDKVTPAPEVAAPVQEAVAPAPEAVPSASTIMEVVAPTPESTPTPEVAEPTQDTITPAPEAVAPTPEAASTPDAPAPAPVEAPAIPAQEEEKPAPEVATPAQDTAAPTPEVTAPAQTEAPAAPAPAAAPEAPTIIEAAAPTPEVPAPESVPPAPTTTEVVAPTSEAVASVQPETPVAPAPEVVAPALAGAPGIAVDRFEFSYGLEHPALPPLDELKGLTVQATRDGQVFRAPAASGAENLTLNAIPTGSRFDADMLRGIAQDVVRWYNQRGLFGVWVAYSDFETADSGLVDNRPADNHAARLTIWASQISEVRTLARGKRVKQQFSINNRKHRGIISNSPLHPGETPEQPGSLFNQHLLDDYLYGLSLHPGRRVEASIASAGQPGKVVLDYLVNESKSWQIFSQANNYGTEATGEYRFRLGFQHNQLTNRDDIFNIDVISTPDAKTYGTFLSYRIPILRPARLLARVFGSYGDFVASDASIENLRFAGNNWLGGFELTNQLTLWRNWQLVSVLGAQYNHYGINSRISNIPLVSGQSDFLVPYLGATLTRNAGWWAVAASLRFDHTLSGFANEDATTGLPALGRLDADADWTSARWNLSGTVYLDSLFRRDAKFHALVHEASLRVKGRVLLRGERLIPHEQEPMGGALSIRGYPESVISADEFYATTFEYAWHLPRMLKPGEPGKLFRWPFKWRPVQAGQNSDWDLAVRAFFDFGHRAVTPIKPDPRIPVDPDNPVITALVDRNLNMAGYGGGITLLVKQNFTLRADYAVALNELRDDTRPEGLEVVLPKGNSQVYLVSSFSW